jgi:TctA family transporter
VEIAQVSPDILGSVIRVIVGQIVKVLPGLGAADKFLGFLFPQFSLFPVCGRKMALTLLCGGYHRAAVFFQTTRRVHLNSSLIYSLGGSHHKYTYPAKPGHKSTAS